MGSATNGNGEPRGVVAVGASAGGVEALTKFAAGLPDDLPFPILVALHMPAGLSSVLHRIMDRSGPLTAVAATNGAPLQAGTIYVALPGQHLLVRGDHVVLSDGPTENGHRPAINALFRSVALAHGQQAISVLLSGVLDDGVLGSQAIHRRGGTTIVQRPTDALFAAMPLNALEAGVIDHEASAAEMGGMLAKLAEREFEERAMDRDTDMELENRIAMGRRFSTWFDTETLGPPSGYTCPDCHGSLQAVSDSNYRCHVGHAWTGESLLRARDEEVECALWMALRSLQEKSKLARKMAHHVGSGVLHEKYSARANEAEHAVSVLGDRLSEAYGYADERVGS